MASKRMDAHGKSALVIVSSLRPNHWYSASNRLQIKVKCRLQCVDYALAIYDFMSYRKPQAATPVCYFQTVSRGSEQTQFVRIWSR